MADSISVQQKKELTALSGGICPLCGQPLIDAQKRFNGIIAHIYGHNDGATRYNSNLSEAQKNANENLIMICSNCHVSVDKEPEVYTVEYLLEAKYKHEESVYGVLSSSVISDQTSLYGGEKPKSLKKLNEFFIEKYDVELDEPTTNNLNRQINILFNLSVFQRHIFLDLVTSFFSDKDESNYRLTLAYFSSAYPNVNVLTALETSGLIDTSSFELQEDKDKVVDFDYETWEFLIDFCEENTINLSELIVYRKFNFLE